GEDFEVAGGREAEGDTQESVAGVASGFADGAVDGDGGGGATSVEETLIVGEAAVLIEEQEAAGWDVENCTGDEGNGVGLAGEGDCGGGEIESALVQDVAAAIDVAAVEVDAAGSDVES